jgi:hypothetical protein
MPEIPGKFRRMEDGGWRMVGWRDGEDQCDRSCENVNVLHRVKEHRNHVHGVKIRKTLRKNCLSDTLYSERGGRKPKQLLDDLKEKRIY